MSAVVRFGLLDLQLFGIVETSDAAVATLRGSMMKARIMDLASPRPRCVMSETYQDIVARLPTETELIRRLIHGPRKAGNSEFIDPLCTRISAATGHGKGFSRAICIRYGFDPNERSRPPLARIPTGPLAD